MAKSYGNFKLQHGRKQKVKFTIFIVKVLPCLLHLIPNCPQAFNKTVRKAKEVVICKDILSTKLVTLRCTRPGLGYQFPGYFILYQ